MMVCLAKEARMKAASYWLWTNDISFNVCCLQDVFVVVFAVVFYVAYSVSIGANASQSWYN